jgi:multimeric flavodoxin WrbA
MLKDKTKNPTGFHRCWCSLNNKSDELWKVSKEIFESDAVIFFVSIRWGQTNAFYQKLIERLSWIENRHATLGENNIVAGKLAGMITIGQNWNGDRVLETQKEVLEFYGFTVPYELSFHWQYTSDLLDESEESYIKAPEKFSKDFDVEL